MGLGIPINSKLNPKLNSISKSLGTNSNSIWVKFTNKIQILKIICCQRNRKDNTLPYGKAHVLKFSSNAQIHLSWINQIFYEQKFVSTAF